MTSNDLADYAIVLNARDNVATAVRDIPAGRYVLRLGGQACEIAVGEAIRAGFKLALSDIAAGERVYKYGHVIGSATAGIKRGQCVHVHNIAGAV